MALKDRASSISGGFTLFVVNTALRFLQFVFAITVAGLYGTDLHNVSKHGYRADGRWVYAEVVAGLAALTSIVYMIPLFKTYVFFGWDLILFILWVALFGIFGKLYIHQHADGNGNVQRMKNAVWIDFVNLLLWLVSAVYGGALFLKFKSHRSLFTGRAAV